MMDFMNRWCPLHWGTCLNPREGWTILGGMCMGIGLVALTMFLLFWVYAR